MHKLSCRGLHRSGIFKPTMSDAGWRLRCVCAATMTHGTHEWHQCRSSCCDSPSCQPQDGKVPASPAAVALARAALCTHSGKRGSGAIACQVASRWQRDAPPMRSHLRGTCVLRTCCDNVYLAQTGMADLLHLHTWTCIVYWEVVTLWSSSGSAIRQCLQTLNRSDNRARNTLSIRFKMSPRTGCCMPAHY